MTTHSIKAIIFDLGKVLVDFDYEIAKRRILERSSNSRNEVMASLESSEMLIHYEKGRMTSEEFYRAVQKASGYRGNYEEFGASFSDIFSPMPPMIDLFHQVKGRGFKAFIFSNTNELAVRHISASFDFYNHFDGHVLSYEHGFLKPESGLYEVVERLTGHSGPELVYIDDRPENIQAGADRGWNAVLQEAPEKTRDAFKKLGMLQES